MIWWGMSRMIWWCVSHEHCSPGRSGCLQICSLFVWQPLPADLHLRGPFLFIWDFLPYRQLLTLPTASRAPGLRQSVSLGALPSTDQTQESAWVFPLFTVFWQLPSLFRGSLCWSMELVLVATMSGRMASRALWTSWPESKTRRTRLCAGSACLCPCLPRSGVQQAGQ